MLRFRRPNKPPSFEAAVASTRRDVKDAIAAGNQPEFPDLWKRFKPMFARAQRGKCGYCEIKVLAGYWGDVEHFAPKGAVWELKDDPATWGIETEDASNVAGRERNEVSTTGYWWLAYEWRNYLLACVICNSAWKGSFFHVETLPRQVPPAEAVSERPTLLGPFSSERFEQHFRYSDLGQIEGLTVQGSDTIRTCGLDREQLRDTRSEKAIKCHDLARRLAERPSTAAQDQIYRDFLDLGRKSHANAGMVRILFAQLTYSSWEDLESIFGERNT